MTQSDSPFDITLHENEFFSKLALPETGSPSRMTTYQKAIRHLPLPPALWDAFQRACYRGDSSQKLGEIIKDDPVLAASILRIANAPGLGVRHEISDVGRAVAHLGTSLVRSIVSRHSFSASLAQSGKVYDIKRLWKHGMAVSALAEIVADFIPNCHAEEASTLGLFHDIGKMSLNLFPEFVQAANFEASKGHLMYEHDRFSCTHVELGVLLAKHWQLPDKITQGISYHHHPAYAQADAIPDDIRAEVFAVYLADLLAIHLGFDTGDSGMVLPHESFACMLQGTTLMKILASEKLNHEIKRIENIQF